MRTSPSDALNQLAQYAQELEGLTREVEEKQEKIFSIQGKVEELQAQSGLRVRSHLFGKVRGRPLGSTTRTSEPSSDSSETRQYMPREEKNEIVQEVREKIVQASPRKITVNELLEQLEAEGRRYPRRIIAEAVRRLREENSIAWEKQGVQAYYWHQSNAQH